MDSSVRSPGSRRLRSCLGAALLAGALLDASAAAPASPRETVGHKADGRSVTPVNQTLTPLGRQIELTGLRPQAMALSPDGSRLLVSGKTSELLVLSPVTGEVLQRVALPSEQVNEPQPAVPSANILKPDAKGQVSYTGLIYSPDGKRVFLSNVNGSLKVFRVGADGSLSPSHSLPLPRADAPRRKEEIPAGLAFSADGRRLYVCANLSNRLLELDPESGKVLREFRVGVAPYDVVLVGDTAYVSNWGGRRPGPDDLSGPAGRGTTVRVDPVRHIASEGSVSIIDLKAPADGAPQELITGLHASALAVSPNRRHVVCANAGSDTLSVIDTRTRAVVETIWSKINPADLFGASPNALVFAPDGKTLYVANGSQNAIAVIRFDPADRESRLAGLIPVGWFPAALVHDTARRQLIVANVKGMASKLKKSESGADGFNSHQYNGTVSLVPIPARRTLPKLSETVSRNLRREAILASRLPARSGVKPQPVPERIGEPSVFKHVIYIIKENRTYDQVFGDEPRGNGRADLCIFGEKITPNLHKIAREFVLLDNTYCAGILSADGHQWSTTAFSTDYMEKSFAGFPRSYPDGMGEDEADALAYSPAGFIWDNALKHGKTLRNYGEFAEPTVRWRDPKKKGSIPFLPCYRTWKGESDEVVFSSRAMVPTLVPHTPTNYVGWEMSVPDQFRADFFIRELKAFEARGEFPNLTLLCLPNDHTSGTSAGQPTPAACVADNDLAFGRIVEAVSHSRFWKETLILAIEDDPQAGWDHVSGYRTTAFCISPYTRRGAVVSTQYNTTSIIRTAEQVLGMKPMNQFDASATPMSDCFQETPDFTPYTAAPNTVPLDQMNPPAKALLNPILRRDAEVSARLNFREVDKAPEDVLNRILWNAMAGPDRPYPEWAVTPDADDDDD
ncbi:MAG: beta-propeller fold lactonase family protein [Verrucomicrobiota bacterium]